MKLPLILLMAGIFLSACTSARDTPEMKIRQLLKDAETAVEKKDATSLRQLISEKYTDSQGQNKKNIEAVLRYYFLRHESIYLLTRIQTVVLPEPARAQLVVMVAMAGQPIVQAQELERLRADLYRFEITLIDENKTWKLGRAEWRPAELHDFIDPRF